MFPDFRSNFADYSLITVRHDGQNYKVQIVVNQNEVVCLVTSCPTSVVSQEQQLSEIALTQFDCESMFPFMNENSVCTNGLVKCGATAG